MPLSARRMVPLFLLLTFLCLFTLRYVSEMASLEVSVMEQEQLRLRERLNTEQTRLDSQAGMGENLLFRRVVGGLGLYTGLERAYLVGGDGQVRASLTRRDLARPLDEVLKAPGAQNAALRSGWQRPRSLVIEVERVPGSPLLLGWRLSPE